MISYFPWILKTFYKDKKKKKIAYYYLLIFICICKLVSAYFIYVMGVLNGKQGKSCDKNVLTNELSRANNNMLYASMLGLLLQWICSEGMLK